jgi:sigma-B regulation protein RsbU (phosphoserine phosphatase)
MDSMPPVILGAIILTPLLLALAARKPLIKYFVVSKVAFAQPGRQFFLDFLLYFFASMITMVLNYAFYSAPLGSGVKMIIGATVAGFFLSLDTALARERSVISEMMENHNVLSLPKTLYPMTRKFSLVAVTSIIFVSIILILVISSDITWLRSVEFNEASLSGALRSVAYEILFVMSVLMVLMLNLIFSYSRNLKLLFQNETSVLESVRDGNLTQMVPVATQDEFGSIAEHTNSMIAGLRHRIKLLLSLKLAEEVQRNLLPHNPPVISGLDIAGVSLYCDKVGGDYFDYFKLPDNRLGVVVADSAGHGVGAALHMATARAYMRANIHWADKAGGFVNRVNYLLTRDSIDTGRFATLFFLEINLEAQTLHWVRAGHDPAMVYDPVQDTFQKLEGEGIPLGIVEDFAFEEYTFSNLQANSIIVISTDGIGETRNPDGRMFGLERFQDIIRDNAADSSENIKNAVIKALEQYQGSTSWEDDITLVVIKVDAISK